MKIIVAASDKIYFLWQILVQINNFKKIGYDKKVIYVIAYDPKIGVSKLAKKISGIENIEVHFYPDTRRNIIYSSSIRPHILKKYFQENDNNKSFLYLDPDVLFLKKINFSVFEKNDCWYVSDTRSYIDSKYIRSKSEELFKEMCGIVNIEPTTIIKNDDNAGGAQYIMKNIDKDYWWKVESDSEALYDLMIKTSNKYSPSSPIQAWTADMWAVLWNGWYFEKNIKIAKSLDFIWATDNYDNLKTASIYHNAGVSYNNHNSQFYKSEYNNSMPFNITYDSYDKTRASFRYVEEIIDTKINFEKIIS